MQDWKTLFTTARFRALWLALVWNNLGSWCVIAALPVLVAVRFGVRGELVISLGLRILPKILLAPISGHFLHRFGAKRLAALALAGEGLLTILLPWCDNFAWFQITIAAIGILDVFVMPALLSLRGPAMPPGLELAGNTLCSVADRLAKFAGPIVGGLAILTGFAEAFFAFGLMILAAAICVVRIPAADEEPAPRPRMTERSSFWHLTAEFAAMLRADHILLGLFIAAATYMVMLGGLRPFLFWANRDWFRSSDAAWTGLLAAQGVGALIGALVSGLFARALLRVMSAYALTLVTGLLEGALHLALLLAGSAPQAMVILALASIPEIVSTATWFTAMQQRLSPRQQGVYFSFAIPLWDCGFELGLFSAGLHANGTLSLACYWALVSLGSTLPLLPLLMLHARGRIANNPAP